MKTFILALSALCLLALPAFAATRDEKRAEIQKMRQSVLEQLYKAHPPAREEIEKAAGYAAFSSADVAAIFFSGSYGHGIAHDNETRQDTYMQMASAGVGLGVGVKEFRAVFVFDDRQAFDNFVNTGLDLSANIDAAVKKDSRGQAVTGAATVMPGVRVYQLTDTGLLAQAMLKGTKYWRDAELNERDQSSMLERPYTYNR